MPILIPPAVGTVELTDLLHYVLPQVPSCPDDVALFNLRQAAIEFCQKTTVWRSYQGEIITLADTTAYEFVLDPGQQVTKLLQVFLDGQEVGVVAPEVGRSLEAREVTDTYAFGELEGFNLHPAQVEGMKLLTYSAIMPTEDADTLPLSLRRYWDVIANGTKARLFSMPQSDWFSERAAGMHRSLFLDRVSSIAVSTKRGHAKQRRSPHSRFF